MSFANVFKKGLFVTVNLLFGFIIYFLSMRPLSPSEEQLIIAYNDKGFIGFVIECFVFIFIITIIFSSFSFLTFKILFKQVNKKFKNFLLIFIIYLVFSTLCSLEYFFYIKKLIFQQITIALNKTSQDDNKAGQLSGFIVVKVNLNF